MANAKAILKGTYKSGPKAGKPADLVVLIVDTDVTLVQFVTRNSATALSFSGDVEFYDLVAVTNPATVTRLAPVVDGTIVNERSTLTAFASDPKSTQNARFGAPWTLPMGAQLSYEGFAS